MTDWQAGCSRIVVEGAEPVPVWVLYPTTTAEQRVQLGPYSVELAMDAVPAEGAFPLVLVSHGTGGSPLAYRDLGRVLARAGFVVGLVQHPGNNRDDNSRANTLENLCARPAHLQTVINGFYASERFAPVLVPEAVAVIGHSLGGYTALALAGGEPISMPAELADGTEQAVAVVHDARLRALVLLAPATVWFRYPGALLAVDLPVLLRVGNQDAITPAGFHAAVVLNGVADAQKVDYRLVENAGHFAFASPFPPALCRADFPPSQDPPGFDREGYQAVLAAEVIGFLRRVLGAA